VQRKGEKGGNKGRIR